jgi:hypothetical protein
MENTKLAPLKAYNTQQLAKLYEVTYPTFMKWIKPFESQIGKKNGQLFLIKQVQIIFECLGWPEAQ